ncbi:MAG: DUF72 domain-containing protein [Chthoniobacterales bacterium]
MESSIQSRLQQIASKLRSRNIYVGTSSWKYEGWMGQLYSPERYEYRGKVAKSRFETGCLVEYAETFKTVCVDAGFYRFPDERYIGKLVEQVSEDFLLSFKVTDEITIKKFPNQPRHGERAGKSNVNFLNAELFINAFLGSLSPFRSNIGILMFEFSQFYKGDFEHGSDFVEALDGFFGQLPKGWQYGVEMRNREFLQPDYFAMLHKHNVTHVFNSWSRMPDVSDQMEMGGSFTAGFFASRFLLKPGRAYQEAVDKFSPYKEIQEPYPIARSAIATLASKTPARPSFIFVNNRLEGNALLTIAESLAAL